MHFDNNSTTILIKFHCMFHLQQSRVKESVAVLARAQLASKSGSLKAAMLELQAVASMDLRTLLPPASEIEPSPLPPVVEDRSSNVVFDLTNPSHKV